MMTEAPDLEKAEVRFGPAHRGKVTGYAVSCSEHGAMPVLVKNRAEAITAAGLHLQAEHLGHGSIRELGNFRARRKGRAHAA